MRSRLLLCTLSLAALAPRAAAQENQPPPGGNLAALFNVAGNVGFSTIRAAYSHPDQPVRPDVADWLRKDAVNSRQWAATVQSCIPFDLARFDEAPSMLQSGRATGRDVWQIVDRLHRDYAAATGRASCTLGARAPNDLPALFSGGLFLGFAIARASYFAGDGPLPQASVDQIRGDLPMVRNTFNALDGCGGDVRAVNGRLDAIAGSMPSQSGRAVWNELIAVYQAIDAILRNVTCAPAAKPAPGGPIDQATCLRTTCAVPCKGAVILLGVVSGSPECTQCIAQNCKK